MDKLKKSLLVCLIVLLLALSIFPLQAFVQQFGTTLIYGVPVIASLILTLVFPFFMLGGFFEYRKDGVYRFQTKRFFVTVMALIILSFISAISLDYGISDLVIGASKVAEKADLHNRMAAEYALRNEAVLFPEQLNKEKLACYRAATSNYIEDQWQSFFREENCGNGNKNCAYDETTYYYAALNTIHAVNLTDDMSAIGYTLGMIWKTAADMYVLHRQLFHVPDNNKSPPHPIDGKTLLNYNYYFDDCISLKPLPWAAVGEPLLVTRPHLCWGRCS